MSASPRAGTRQTLLPPAVRAYLRRRLMQIGGATVLAIGIGMALALLSYAPSDPSWNRASGALGTANWLGPFGAYPADLLIQSIGFAAWGLTAVVLIWGFRLLAVRPFHRPWLRLAALIVAVLALAAALDPLDAPADWPTAAGLGGAFGRLLADAVATGFGQFARPIVRGWVVLGAAMTALLVGAVALGLEAREWGGLLRASIRTVGYASVQAADAGRRGLSRSVAAASALRRRDRPDAAELPEPVEPDPPGWGEPSRREAGDGQESFLSGFFRRTPRFDRTLPGDPGHRDEDDRDPRGAAAEEAEDVQDAAAEPIPVSPFAEPLERPGEPEAKRTDPAARVASLVTALSRRAQEPERVTPKLGGPPGAAPPPAEKAAQRAAPRKQRRATGQGSLLGRDDGYELPALELLDAPKATARRPEGDEAQLKARAEELQQVLGDFGVKGEIVRVRPGPVVTLFELEPAPGTKSSRVIGLADDIARSMSAISVRVAVVPGRSVIGIELPNEIRETVFLSDVLAHDSYEASPAKLALMLGKDIGGNPIVADLARMPHLLVAGTTGSGKSVAINTMILSLLYRLPPDRVRLILIDPKMLELSVYEDIPHLLSPVVTEPKKAVVALKWAVREMEDRYRAMSRLGVRNIEGFNQRLRDVRAKGESLTRRVQTGFDPDTGKPVFEDEPMDLTELPYIVVVVDEMADLMMVAGKDIEAAIQRLAQMARAAGIHLIMATQRPSVDVITGTIKANFPTRISFQVTSKIDSRTILGEGGAEQLLGQGDMLYMAGGGRITRVHGPFVSDAEVERVVAYLKSQGEPAYNDAVTEEPEDGMGDIPGFGGGGDGEEDGDDGLYNQAVQLVAREKKASTSFIQRHLKIGYNRAARLIERMESEGIVSQANHVGKREVLIGGGE